MEHKQLFLRRPFKYKYTHVTFKIILVNLIVFAICFFSNDIYNFLYYYCCMNPALVKFKHMYWQFITYMFMHYDIKHLLFNMIGLLVFGLPLEKAIGSKEILLFYIVCGSLSGFFSFLFFRFTGNYNTFLLGASGAIYAILFGYAVFFPRSIIYIWGIIPVPAPILVLIYVIIELGSQFLGRSTNVAHMTHLFGFLAALLYFLIRMGVNPLKIWKKTY